MVRRELVARPAVVVPEPASRAWPAPGQAPEQQERPSSAGPEGRRPATSVRVTGRRPVGPARPGTVPGPTVPGPMAPGRALLGRMLLGRVVHGRVVRKPVARLGGTGTGTVAVVARPVAVATTVAVVPPRVLRGATLLLGPRPDGGSGPNVHRGPVAIPAMAGRRVLRRRVDRVPTAIHAMLRPAPVAAIRATPVRARLAGIHGTRALVPVLAIRGIRPRVRVAAIRGIRLRVPAVAPRATVEVHAAVDRAASPGTALLLGVAIRPAHAVVATAVAELRETPARPMTARRLPVNDGNGAIGRPETVRLRPPVARDRVEPGARPAADAR